MLDLVNIVHDGIYILKHKYLVALLLGIVYTA